MLTITTHPVTPIMANHEIAAYAYAALEHDPHNGRVAASYAAFKRQTVDQWVDILMGGIVVDFHTGDHDYASSADMFADLATGHLWTFLTDPEDSQLPEDHPMLERVEFYGGRWLTLNDIFRAVHDVNGHGRSGGSFALSGEYAAWLEHRTLYTADALPALWCETRGQSAWTNRYGNHAALPLRERPFADQRAGWPLADLV